jgi:hypothetical protein
VDRKSPYISVIPQFFVVPYFSFTFNAINHLHKPSWFGSSFNLLLEIQSFFYLCPYYNLYCCGSKEGPNMNPWEWWLLELCWTYISPSKQEASKCALICSSSSEILD